jgi:hypothetical protein
VETRKDGSRAKESCVRTSRCVFMKLLVLANHDPSIGRVFPRPHIVRLLDAWREKRVVKMLERKPDRGGLAAVSCPVEHSEGIA